ncbi:MAG: sigma-70 family RNA polymerase sigma factor [Flavobacteriaceae bacterium]|nr:sigma-70 family RNA polymerase sigma factor [Flavobacteriaceae bacterium]
MARLVNLHISIETLVHSAQQNKATAQYALFKKFAPGMKAVAFRYVKDEHQAEDLLQNAFIKCFKQLKHFEFKGSFEAWLRKIVVNECLDFLRTKKHIQFEDAQLESLQEFYNPLENLHAREHLEKLIDQLPEGYKLVFMMYCIEGYKHDEIAELLNISIGTSKSQLFKARKWLQNEFYNTNELQHGSK